MQRNQFCFTYFNKALRPRLEIEGQGVALHHHLANIVESQQLRPLVRVLPLMLEREVLDHVQAGHRHSQQEERDLCHLPPPNQQAFGQVLVYAIVFSLSSLFPFRQGKRSADFKTDPASICLMILHSCANETVCCK